MSIIQSPPTTRGNSRIAPGSPPSRRLIASVVVIGLTLTATAGAGRLDYAESPFLMAQAHTNEMFLAGSNVVTVQQLPDAHTVTPLPTMLIGVGIIGGGLVTMLAAERGGTVGWIGLSGVTVGALVATSGHTVRKRYAVTSY